MNSRSRIPVTEDGLRTLREEYQHLVKNERPRIARLIGEAREFGDLRENAAYDAAKHDQALIERRIRELEQTLKRVDLIDEKAKRNGVVSVGSTVTIEIDGEEETYTIVGAVEAKPAEGRISNESPIGKALLGASAGDDVTIETPSMDMRARVLRVE
jgi:transcription elongation factor GreA